MSKPEVPFTVYVSREQLECLDEQARNEDRSRSWLVRTLLFPALERRKRERRKLGIEDRAPEFA